MNTFLIQVDYEIMPCFGINRRGKKLCAIVKSYEYKKEDKYNDLVFEEGFLEIDFADQDDLINNLDEALGRLYGKEKNGFTVIRKYPSREWIESELNYELYFDKIIRRIKEYIYENKIPDLHSIANDALNNYFVYILDAGTEYEYKK